MQWDPCRNEWNPMKKVSSDPGKEFGMARVFFPTNTFELIKTTIYKIRRRILILLLNIYIEWNKIYIYIKIIMEINIFLPYT